MGMDTLLGNEHIKENLARSLEKGHISHFYLISGPEGSGKRTLAKLLASAILCQGKNKPGRIFMCSPMNPTTRSISSQEPRTWACRGRTPC